MILDKSEDIPKSLLFTLLFTLGQKRSDASGAARRLSMNVIGHFVGKFETPTKQVLSSSISGDIVAPSNLHQCPPQILFGVIPYITGSGISLIQLTYFCIRIQLMFYYYFP